MKLISEVAKDCLELPSAQRLKLARILMEASEPDLDFSPGTETAWEDEIGARLEAVKNGTARSRSLSAVMAELDRRYPE